MMSACAQSSFPNRSSDRISGASTSVPPSKLLARNCSSLSSDCGSSLSSNSFTSPGPLK
eukprot:CAMPEP_0177784834 /NCGR_PEP_ID=MMETSP0491_2-20121128/19946_1 /TAXON_ID=63592 /ORGANISM="Tetraselmis chuii, Strain PLY429" /LENGTH=58 /DNA_ID=CAMNT_0019305695 /DNA_START=32 /DNA_END=205 /DNA_ORIENTATION=+